MKCRAVVADLVAKFARLEPVLAEMLQTIYGQGGLDLVYRGKLPQHCAAEGSHDIGSPTHGLISDAEQTWRHTLDRFKLEGMFEAHGAESPCLSLLLQELFGKNVGELLTKTQTTPPDMWAHPEDQGPVAATLWPLQEEQNPSPNTA